MDLAKRKCFENGIGRASAKIVPREKMSMNGMEIYSRPRMIFLNISLAHFSAYVNLAIAGRNETNSREKENIKKEIKRTNWAEEIKIELRRRKAKGYIRPRKELSNWMDGFNFSHKPMVIFLTDEEIKELGL